MVVAAGADGQHSRCNGADAIQALRESSARSPATPRANSHGGGRSCHVHLREEAAQGTFAAFRLESETVATGCTVARQGVAKVEASKGCLGGGSARRGRGTQRGMGCLASPSTRRGRGTCFAGHIQMLFVLIFFAIAFLILVFLFSSIVIACPGSPWWRSRSR